MHNEDATRCARLVDVRASAGSGASASSRRFQGLTFAVNTLVYTAEMTALPNPLPAQALRGGYSCRWRCPRVFSA